MSTLKRRSRAACASLAIVGALASASSHAEVSKEPERFIPVYVQPYYESAGKAGEAPEVHVGSRFDALLMSVEQKDILAVEALFEEKPELVSPMSMMALAIRLYDVGLREKSAFWFYASKDRIFSVSKVLDFEAPGLAPAWEATKAFAELAGPYINGYAFCDKERQKTIARDALAWTLAHPYMIVESAAAAKKPGDYKMLWKAGIDQVVSNQKEQEAWMDDPAHSKKFDENRKKSFSAERFCW